MVDSGRCLNTEPESIVSRTRAVAEVVIRSNGILAIAFCLAESRGYSAIAFGGAHAIAIQTAKQSLAIQLPYPDSLIVSNCISGAISRIEDIPIRMSFRHVAAAESSTHFKSTQIDTNRC